MEKNKWTLVTIIILLFVFIPCTIIGMMKRFEEVNKEHNFFYDGELYFYNNNELIGKYTCKTDKCDYAEYREIDTGNLKKTSLVNNKYALIKDGEIIYLYDIESNNIIIEYQELKAYSNPILNNSYITKSKDKWGIISLSPSLLPVLINEYDDVYLNYNINKQFVDLDNIIIKKEENYKILNKNEEIFSSLNKIVECNDIMVVTLLEDGTYKILNYDNQDYFSTDVITNYIIIDNYLAIWTLSGLDIYSIDINADYSLNYIASYSIAAEVKIEENSINIYENEQIISSYEKIIEN